MLYWFGNSYSACQYREDLSVTFRCVTWNDSHSKHLWTQCPTPPFILSTHVYWLTFYVMNQTQLQAYWWVQCTSRAAPANPWWQWSHLTCHVSDLWASQIVLVVKNLPATSGDISDTGSTSGLGRPPGGGHGNCPQCSYLKNPMVRGAWQAAVHSVAQSRTRLKCLSRLTRYLISMPCWNSSPHLAPARHLPSSSSARPLPQPPWSLSSQWHGWCRENRQSWAC